jgi:putative ABC transport system permease protein
MSFIELPRLVLHNLLRMRVRVVMTAVGVMIGTASVVILVSLGEGLQRQALRSIERIGALNEIQVSPGFGRSQGPNAQSAQTSSQQQTKLTDRAIEDIRKIDGVQAAAPILTLDSVVIMKTGRLEGGGQIQGVAPELAPNLGFTVQTGTLKIGNGQTVIGVRVGEQFYDTRNPPRFDPNKPFVPTRHDLYGKTIEMKLQKQAEDGKLVERVIKVRVAGVLKESGEQKDYSLFLSQNEVIELNTWFRVQRPNYLRDGYPQVLVRTKSVNDAERVNTELKKRGFQVVSPIEFIKQIQQQFRIVQAVLGGIGGIALLVAAFGIANTMIMAIYERTREIGLMKAVGATNRDVLLVFLIEAAAIGFLGGVAGVLLGIGGGQIVNGILQSTLPTGPGAQPINVVATPLWLPIFSVAFATLVGLLSGLYPATRATRLDPIVALRQS